MVAKPKTCPCCGAVVLDSVIFPRAKVKQAILEYIRAHPGANAAEIISSVYQLDPNGGPSTLSVINVHIHQMRPRLAREGLTIRGYHGRGGGYVLIPLDSSNVTL